MIEHYLNGVRVYPSVEDDIQITAENPMLTDTGSYSLEVKYPLSIFENRDFFGALNRTDVTKKYTTWNVEVKNLEQVILQGTATLIKATESEVSVQYLAGNSQVNFWNKAEDTYIDEYDFNTMENGQDRVEGWRQSIALLYDLCENYNNFTYGNSQNGGKNRVHKGIHLFWRNDNPHQVSRPFVGKEGEFVFCNVYDEDYNWSAETSSPAPIRVGNGTLWENDIKKRRQIGGTVIIDIFSGTGFYLSCIQPHLLWVIKQVIAKRGYTIERNDIETLDYMQDMYIASARQTLKIADALPHWTIKDFFEQVQNFFNCTLVFNEEKRTCSIIFNNGMTNAEEVELEKVVDEHEESIAKEEKGKDNIISSNIRYKDIGKEDAIRCDDSTRKKYDTVWGDSYNELKAKAQADSEGKWKIYKNTQYKGLSYGYTTEGELLVIDYLCPLERGSQNYIDLKIVPARTAEKYYSTGVPNRKDEGFSHYGQKQNVLTMSNNWGGYECEEGDLVKVVLGQAEGKQKKDKEDFLPVFFYNGHKYGEGCRIYEDPKETQKTIDIKNDNSGIAIPVGDPYTGKYWHNVGNTNYRKNFCMALVPGHLATYHGKVFNNMPKLNTENVLKEEFIYYSVPNPRAVYIIKGKRYLAQKIEYKIDKEGINPLMTGYFVEILEG